MLKYGFHDFHDKNCVIELKGECRSYRSWWCSTHKRWCYEYPVTIITVFEDGKTNIRDNLPVLRASRND